MTNVTACISVDWEGIHLKGVAALQQFNDQLPSIPITHFISAAYLARAVDSEQTAAIVKAMAPAIKASDEIGLHVHCWRSLCDYQDGTSYLTDRDDPVIDCDYADQHYTDSGYVIALTSLKKTAINAFIDVSLQKLRELLAATQPLDGPPRSITGFRSGGWLVDDQVFAVLQDGKGFVYDASAVDCQFARRALPDYVGRVEPLVACLGELWGTEAADHNRLNLAATLGCGVRRTTGPYTAGSLIELPNNGMLMPAVQAEDVSRFIGWALEQPRGQEVFVSVGFHQESSPRYIDNFIKAIQPYAQHGRIRWLTHATCAGALT